MTVVLPICPRCGAQDQWGMEAILRYDNPEGVGRRRYRYDAKQMRFVIDADSAPQVVANGYTCGNCNGVYRDFFLIERAFDGVPTDTGFSGEEPILQYDDKGRLIER